MYEPSRPDSSEGELHRHGGRHAGQDPKPMIGSSDWTNQKLIEGAMEKIKTALPLDSQARKDIPMATGLLDYFPAALAEVARLSKAANEKHNPGEEMHHARGKSSDHADTIVRHLAERGIMDDDGFYHDVKVAWRALAQLQELLEKKAGVPLARAARLPGADKVPVPKEIASCPDSPPVVGKRGSYNLMCELEPGHPGLHTAFVGQHDKVTWP